LFLNINLLVVVFHHLDVFLLFVVVLLVIYFLLILFILLLFGDIGMAIFYIYPFIE